MPRRQKQYHYIYKTTCLVTGKFYVGMHSTDDLDDGYLGSGKILGYSRSKHGDENHRKEMLEMLPSREALKLREKEIVNEALLADPLNINLKYGGEGGWDHKPGLLIQHQVVDAIARSAKATTTMLMRAAADPDYRLRINEAISASLVGRSGWSRGTTGKNFKKTPGSASGDKNSQFGTCWVTKDAPIKIKKIDLERYLADGFVRGRRLP